VKDNIVTYTYNAFDENYYRIKVSKPLAVGRVAGDAPDEGAAGGCHARRIAVLLS